MAEGLIVVRGPDWKWGNQDGGEGGKGTVLKALRKSTIIGSKECTARTAIVKWSNGSGNVYRVGAEGAYDLRVLDNSSTSGRHKDVKCDACDNVNFRGIRWKCAVCSDYDLCTECYRSGKHDLSHEFWRIYTPDANREKVPKRSGATRVRVRRGGSIVGAVLELLGRTDSESEFYYPTHLPVFELPPFIVDDKVRIHGDRSYVRLKQIGHGGWEEEMAASLGKIGKVVEVDSDGDLKVQFADCKWFYNPDCAKRIDDSDVTTFEDIETALGSALSELLNENGAVLTGLLRSLSSLEERASTSSSEPSGRVAEMTDQKDDYSGQDKEGNTQLHLAAENGNVDVGEFLLKKKVDVNVMNAQGQSAMHLAVLGGSSAFVKLLLHNGCSVQIPDSYGNTALNYAIGAKDPEIVNLLLDYPETNVKLKNNAGNNALHHAVWAGNNYALEKIIEKDPYLVDTENDDGITALHLAVQSDHYDAAKILIETGRCKLEVHNQMKETPLLVAVRKSLCAEVELLVFFDADLAAKDAHGNTALHLALLNQRIEDGITPTNAPAISRIFSNIRKLPGVESNFGLAIACFLAQKGGSLEVENGAGKTPLDLVPSTVIREMLIEYSRKTVKVPSATCETNPKTVEPNEECMVCGDEKDLVLLKPCNHRIVCQECSLIMKKCLVCKVEIIQEKRAEAAKETVSQSSSESSENPSYNELRRRDILGVLGAKKR